MKEKKRFKKRRNKRGRKILTGWEKKKNKKRFKCKD